MFCPKCGAQNKAEQKFCRSCGQALSPVRMALEGKIDEVATALAKDREKIAAGALTLVIFVLIALLASFFPGPSAVINLILGLLIGATITWRGLRRLDRSIKLLDPKEQSLPKLEAAPTQPALAQAEPAIAAVSAVPDTDPLMTGPAAASVTEHTTLHLNRSE